MGTTNDEDVFGLLESEIKTLILSYSVTTYKNIHPCTLTYMCLSDSDQLKLKFSGSQRGDGCRIS